VFQPTFAQGGLLIARSNGAETPTPTLHESLTRFLGEKSSTLIFVTAQAETLPDGPYFVSGHSLHRALRLYPDENLAFTQAVTRPDEQNAPYQYEWHRPSCFNLETAC
jgi:hypothetical protein